jgi:hypothetical protein
MSLAQSRGVSVVKTSFRGKEGTDRPAATPPAAAFGKNKEPRPNAKDAESCGAGGAQSAEDGEEEEEEMFVDPHESFPIRVREWGGPRRGGRFPEPTRYNDWERNGRCSDF